MIAKIKRFLYSLPGVRTLVGIRSDIREIHALHRLQARISNEILREQILSGHRYEDSLRLSRHEMKHFSQNGEDGIISEIFKRIGTLNRICVEFGVQNGEQNTGYLLLQGWKAFWLEGSTESCNAIRESAKEYIGSGRLVLGNEFITRENIAPLFNKYSIPHEVDLLSIDLDRNTSHVWPALKEWEPRVVVIEYNASFSPNDSWEIPYAANRVWNRTAYCNASLLRLEEIGKELGYCLVGCDLTGTNAFFVREDLAGDKFCKPYTAANHYELPRYLLSGLGGHPPALSD